MEVAINIMGIVIGIISGDINLFWNKPGKVLQV